jgi:hypothetical protein
LGCLDLAVFVVGALRNISPPKWDLSQFIN